MGRCQVEKLEGAIRLGLLADGTRKWRLSHFCDLGRFGGKAGGWQATLDEALGDGVAGQAGNVMDI